MMSEINVGSLIKYGQGIAEEFKARRNRIRNFVTDHNLTSGTANEMILRDFLASLSPRRYTVGQGFICNPTRPSQVSRQCDILVLRYCQMLWMGISSAAHADGVRANRL